MNNKTKKLTAIGMLCAIAYASTAVGRIPLVLFLKYDPKDVILAISGFIFGPLTAFLIALTVSLTEMVTISETGIWGFFMNVVSSCAFACTAACIYKKTRALSGAIAGLFCGWGCMVFAMLLWNYLITPFYMGYSREVVMELLIPVFLPFNFIKGGLNAAITMLAYKPVVTALRRSHFIEPAQPMKKARSNAGVILTALSIITTCVLFVLSLRGLF